MSDRHIRIEKALKGLGVLEQAQVEALIEALRPAKRPVNGWAFGAALRNARKAEGWSQERLAKIVGTSPVYVCQLETGKRRSPSAQLVKVLCIALALDWKDWFIRIRVASSPEWAEVFPRPPAASGERSEQPSDAAAAPGGTG